MILNNGQFQWEASCSGDRRHICVMEPAPDAPCGPPFYELEKCVKYFPEAGFLSWSAAKAFCDVHGGKLAEEAQSPTVDLTYINGK